MAAYSDRVDRVLKAHQKRIAPNMRAQFKQMGLDALAKKNFADVTGDEEKAFAAWETFVASLPESEKFAAGVEDAKPKGKVEATPLVADILRPGGFLDRHLNTRDMRTRYNVSAN